VETFGTGKLNDDQIAALVERFFDFRLAAIVRQFNLRYLPSRVTGGFYRKLAAYGHMGRMDIGLPWEVTDKAALLREEVGNSVV
jgi:S-adenosylmethionine synthetase